MADRFWVGGSGAWDETNTANWSTTPGGAGGASVPTVTDDVYFGSWSGGGTVSIGGAIASIGCGSIYCEAGYAGTFTNAGYGLLIYGSVVFTPDMVAINFTVILSGSAGGNHTVDLAGITVLKILSSAGSSTYTAASDIVTVAQVSLVVNFDLAGFNIRTQYFNSVAGSNAITLNLGSGVIYIDSVNSGPFRVTGTATVLVAAEASIVINHIATPTKVLTAPSGTIFGALTLTGQPQTVTLGYASLTYKTLVSSAGTTIKFPAGLTTTIENFAVKGSTTNYATITSSSSTVANIVYAGVGIVSTDHIHASYINATPATTTWYVGRNSANFTQNTGLIFDYPPSPNGGLLFGSNF